VFSIDLGLDLGHHLGGMSHQVQVQLGPFGGEAAKVQVFLVSILVISGLARSRSSFLERRSGSDRSCTNFKCSGSGLTLRFFQTLGGSYSFVIGVTTTDCTTIVVFKIRHNKRT
jgi:hypothetical protein